MWLARLPITPSTAPTGFALAIASNSWRYSVELRERALKMNTCLSRMRAAQTPVIPSRDGVLTLGQETASDFAVPAHAKGQELANRIGAG